jgi:hypothetical protein
MELARRFVHLGSSIYTVVYDNVNFTQRKASQRLDSSTNQTNATTSVVVALPCEFDLRRYHKALSSPWTHGARARMQLVDITPSSKEQNQMIEFMVANVMSILLEHSWIVHPKVKPRLQKELSRMQEALSVRVLRPNKTQFFPLKALDQEEASVHGTLCVVDGIWLSHLGFTKDGASNYMKLMNGDWLSIRNLRLMQHERQFESNPYNRMDWVGDASGPFHVQLNNMYCMYRTHVGDSKDGDPASLSAHNTVLCRAKFDTKKPKYNKARQLLLHSLTAWIFDIARYV